MSEGKMMRTQLLATVIMATVAFPALAAESSPIPAWGTAKAPGAAARRAPVDIGSIAAANVFTKANYGTGSVALRNRLAGGLEVSTVPTPVKAAFLYWAVITDGSVPAADTKPTLKRLSPSTASVTLTGKVVGTGASPCWGGTGITVFKATVPTSVANGNGLYEIVFPTGASGSSRGNDPWFGTQNFP